MASTPIPSLANTHTHTRLLPFLFTRSQEIGKDRRKELSLFPPHTLRPSHDTGGHCGPILCYLCCSLTGLSLSRGWSHSLPQRCRRQSLACVRGALAAGQWGSVWCVLTHTCISFLPDTAVSTAQKPWILVSRWTPQSVFDPVPVDWGAEASEGRLPS